MKNTNSKEFKDSLKAYLLPIIEEKAEGYNVRVAHPFAWIVKTAKEEVGFEFERKGDQSGLEYWLSGLGLDIAYTYADIIEVCKSLHGCELTETQEDKFCDEWFSFISAKILQFSREV